MGLKVVQIGANRGNDELSKYIYDNYKNKIIKIYKKFKEFEDSDILEVPIEFGLFVEANSLHIEELKRFYSTCENIFIENVAIKTPSKQGNTLTMYYHTADAPEYVLTSCNIEHIKDHIKHPGSHLTYGEIKSFEVPCISLDDLLQKYNVTELDLLYLDVEGLDAEILLTLDWKKYKIKKVEFEFIHAGSYKNKLKSMMTNMGYTQVDPLHKFNWAFEKISWDDDYFRNTL